MKVGRIVGCFGIILSLTVVFCLFTMIPWGGLRKKDDAFHEAVFDRDYATAGRFLKEGKHPDATGLDSADAPTLLDALANDDLRMADLLFAYGANVNRVWRGQPLIFHMAIQDSAEDAGQVGYRWLLRHGAKPNADTRALLRRPPGDRSVAISSDGLFHFPPQ